MEEERHFFFIVRPLDVIWGLGLDDLLGSDNFIKREKEMSPLEAFRLLHFHCNIDMCEVWRHDFKHAFHLLKFALFSPLHCNIDICGGMETLF